MANWTIETRGEMGWTREGLGVSAAENIFPSERAAKSAIKSLRSLGGEWAVAEYRARELSAARNPKPRAKNACVCPPAANPKRKPRKRASNPKKIRAQITLTGKEMTAWSQPGPRLRILAKARAVAKKHGGAATVHAPGGRKLATVG